ncbi:MAG TPA: hypothetical protein PK054_09335 [Anaerohalosphaeraceae bacterium]|nr:hypothetical protein [Anaerohalosphaeraceae bacterium]HOL89325.1 hypothetical protein [Anaerohalosphaeraceae bacterium]HPP56764.1 hypothetical protein [Anaerohalosphaeraceae bacterium]
MKQAIWFAAAAGLMFGTVAAQARTKLAALPQRESVDIRMDNPTFTLIEEERILTLRKGLNQVDFAWQSVSIDPDSIRLTPLDHPDGVRILNVSFPPGEAALVWEIASDGDWAERVRISYLLGQIDRLTAYKAVADKDETKLDLTAYLIVRNFSGEPFASARIRLDADSVFERDLADGQTRQLLWMQTRALPVKKVWTWDSALQPWDPEQLERQNIGIPVRYRLVNEKAAGLGQAALWPGKVRLFQDDGHDSTIFLGEDNLSFLPVGEKAELYIGDSRDIVVTQRKMKEEQINIRRNRKEQIVLFDMDEILTAKIENFKDSPAVLTLIERIPGQWEMKSCSLPYVRKDAETLEFEIALPARNGDKPAVVQLEMHYQRKNVRP